MYFSVIFNTYGKNLRYARFLCKGHTAQQNAADQGHDAPVHAAPQGGSEGGGGPIRAAFTAPGSISAST